ncbi:hypothetical protein PR048_031668 [Dryococelus australis]|uniref:Uncharacterized protein n=1 Tax=Dryococelus australis TaxID=614101 RepID=A0ABQ9G5W7_9NEOP|nr:hypothetical protein PR048_031668 [Dryococelus australis]
MVLRKPPKMSNINGVKVKGHDSRSPTSNMADEMDTDRPGEGLSCRKLSRFTCPRTPDLLHVMGTGSRSRSHVNSKVVLIQYSGRVTSQHGGRHLLQCRMPVCQNTDNYTTDLPQRITTVKVTRVTAETLHTLLARRGDEALDVRVSVALIALPLLDLGRGVPTGPQLISTQGRNCAAVSPDVGLYAFSEWLREYELPRADWRKASRHDAGCVRLEFVEQPAMSPLNPRCTHDIRLVGLFYVMRGDDDRHVRLPRQVHQVLPDTASTQYDTTLASHQDEPGSIPGRATRLSQVVIVPDDTVGRRVFSGISRYLYPQSGAAPYSSQSPSSALKTSLASQKQSSDTHKTPYDLVKRQGVPSEHVNVDVFTQNKRPCPPTQQHPFFSSPQYVRVLLDRDKCETGKYANYKATPLSVRHNNHEQLQEEGRKLSAAGGCHGCGDFSLLARSPLTLTGPCQLPAASAGVIHSPHRLHTRRGRVIVLQMRVTLGTPSITAIQ